jgi:hypothetical protein
MDNVNNPKLVARWVTIPQQPPPPIITTPAALVANHTLSVRSVTAVGMSA